MPDLQFAYPELDPTSAQRVLDQIESGVMPVGTVVADVDEPEAADEPRAADELGTERAETRDSGREQPSDDVDAFGDAVTELARNGGGTARDSGSNEDDDVDETGTYLSLFLPIGLGFGVGLVVARVCGFM